MPKIINILATVKIADTLDLEQIHQSLEGSNFSTSHSSHWLKYRLQPGNHYVAFYKNGKFMIGGVKDPRLIEKIADKIVKQIDEIGIKTKYRTISIHNVVVLDTIVLDKSLEDIIANLDPRKASYEPDQFPGLIYRDAGHSILLFSSGKLILAGCKDFHAAEDVIRKFKCLIEAKEPERYHG